MAQIATQAEVYYDSNSNTYGVSSVCTVGAETGVFSDTTIKAQMVQVRAQLGSPQTITCNTSADGQKWAASAANLKNAGTTWCLDNSGFKKLGTAAAGICS
jgi:tripartite-type tricarboxylate transporter receptor subunit TctC